MVKEVVRAVRITAVPSGPSIVEGVINVRGSMAPVLDIRRRFGLPWRDVDPSQQMVVAWAGRRLVVLRVDAALDLVVVPDESIEDARRSAPGVEHVSGIARLADGVLVIHDLETFLSLDEARELATIAP